MAEVGPIYVALLTIPDHSPLNVYKDVCIAQSRHFDF